MDEFRKSPIQYKNVTKNVTNQNVTSKWEHTVHHLNRTASELSVMMREKCFVADGGKPETCREIVLFSALYLVQHQSCCCFSIWVCMNPPSLNLCLIILYFLLLLHPSHSNFYFRFLSLPTSGDCSMCENKTDHGSLFWFHCGTEVQLACFDNLGVVINHQMEAVQIGGGREGVEEENMRGKYPLLHWFSISSLMQACAKQWLSELHSSCAQTSPALKWTLPQSLWCSVVQSFGCQVWERNDSCIDTCPEKCLKHKY